MKPRISWRRPKPSPHGKPLPPPSVYLVCRESDDWVGDVLWRPPGQTFWRGGRYHAPVVDHGCHLGHAHEPPSEAEVAAKVDQAERFNGTIKLRVNAKR